MRKDMEVTRKTKTEYIEAYSTLRRNHRFTVEVNKKLVKENARLKKEMSKMATKLENIKRWVNRE